jgi:nitric oxide synthase oxygenase domain/subunit
MIRPLEPRVGENRPINVIKREAEAFLKEMLAEGIFPSSEDYEQRVKEVIVEIEENKVECMVWDEVNEGGTTEKIKLQGVSSNGYLQTKEELEWGVRFAWRNSRKCIMRAHCWDLKCVDLRGIKTSKGMVDAIINNAPAAYNEGRIAPTGEFFFARLQATKLTCGQHSFFLKDVLTALDLCSGHTSS